MLGQLGSTEYPPEVLVSQETRDDAAVYRLGDGAVLVQTVDFFTPIVDDAYDWGRIAAANAFSDVYAMGARPVLALNLVAWPIEQLPTGLLARVLEGGAKVAAEAGVAVVGGHSIHDPEPKYGMAVTGFAREDRLLRNSAARPDDQLFLTKPLGIGIITTAIKRERATAEQTAAAIEVMSTLNAAAADAAVEADGEAATDVTGFGLLGHLHNMAAASGVAAEIDAPEVPLLSGTLALAKDGVVPGGTRSNLEFLEPHVRWGDLPEPERLVLADAQTSGGLLVAIPPGRADRLREGLGRRGVDGREVGVVTAGEPGRISIRGRLG